MTSFYTNYHRFGNSIYIRGYENGIPVDNEIKYQPHLFLPSKDGDHTVFRKGTKVSRKDFDTISDFKDFSDKYKDVHNFQIYGCSDVTRQFLSEYYTGEIQWDFDLTKVWYFDIEIKAENGFPKPELADQQMLLITMFEKTEQCMHIWSMNPISPDNQIYDRFKSCDIRTFDDEKEFLKDFMMFVRTTRIDILTGWYSESFDIPYIVNRIKNVLGEPFTKLISPWKIVKSRTVKQENFDSYETFDIGGISHLDALDLYKKFNPGSKESFKLDYIAGLEVGEHKVELPVDSFKESYQPEHWETFVYYCAVDTHLVYKIDAKMQHTKLAMQMGFLAKCSFIDVISAMRLWESIIYNYFKDRNIVEEFRKPNNHKESIVGAYVLSPLVGKHGWTFSIDAEALYPSMMMQHNISPDTFLRMEEGVSIESILAGKLPDGFDPETECLSANGLVTTRKFRGFIPDLADSMGKLRKVAKKEMLLLKQKKEDIKNIIQTLTDANQIEALKKESELYESAIKALDIKQKGIKISANSLYGITAMAYFRYYDYRLAEAITSNGQVMLKKCISDLNSVMNRLAKTENKRYISYGDTDSLYVLVDPIIQSILNGKEPTQDNIVNAIESFVVKGIQPMLDKKFQTLCDSLGALERKIYFKLECIGPSILFLAKKKYIYDILYSEGVRYKEPEMKVMGLEIVRSSTPNVVKDYLKDSVKIVMRGTESELQSYVSTVRTEFMSKDYKDISFPRGCNGLSVYGSPAKIYTKGTPYHVRGALLHNYHIKRLNLSSKYTYIGDGEKVKYIALKMPNPIHENVISYIGRIPEEFGLLSYLDKETQYIKSYLEPLKSILDVIGWEPAYRLKFE